MPGIMAGMGISIGVGIMPEVDAACAICNAPPIPECPHEGQRLEVALNQAQERWGGIDGIRDWVLNHARVQVINTFRQLRDMRNQQMQVALQRLPYYTLYLTYHRNPPIHPQALMELEAQIADMEHKFRAGVDDDWRRCVRRYPEVLDYYFSLVQIQLPAEKDPVLTDPRFGAPVEKPKKLKGGKETFDIPIRKKERKRSRGRTPPAVGVPGAYPRR